MTLTFDILTHEVDRFMPLPRGPLVPIDVKTGSFVYKISCSRFVNRRTNGRTDRWTKRTNVLRTLRLRLAV